MAACLPRLLARYDVDALEVARFINGDPTQPFSQLISGSIDLDNISNSQDLLRSLGYREEVFYHPLHLIRAIQVRGKEVCLNSDYLQELIGWANSRRKLYDLLYSEPHLSAASMLYRALEAAYTQGALDETFFSYSEPEALHFLTHHVAGETPRLLNRLYLWQHYPRLYEHVSDEEDPRLASLYGDWSRRKAFSDRLAQEFGAASEEVAIYVGRDHGEKAIDLKFVGLNANAATQLFAEVQGLQRLSIFVPREVKERLAHNKVQAVIEEAIADLPLAKGENHLFF